MGWNFANALTEAGHQVWVLTHPRGQEPAQRSLALRPVERLHLCYVPETRLMLRLPRRRWKIRYLLWQREAYRVARAVDRQVDVDIVHHVSWSSLQGGSHLWRLNKPFIFGPIGGGQVAPPAFRRYFGRHWPAEALRGFVATHLSPRLPFVRNPVRHADLVLTVNEETMAAVERLGPKRVAHCLDVAVPDSAVSREYPGSGKEWRSMAGELGLSPTSRDRLKTSKADDDVLEVVWVGRILARKGLALALDAIGAVDPEIPLHLRVVGGELAGPLVERAMQNPATARRVECLGFVTFDEVQKILATSHVLLFSSLRDSSGAQILEAMAHGLPVISLDHQGARELLTGRGGIRVPAHHRDETVWALAGALEVLQQDPELRRWLSVAAWQTALDHTWSNRVEMMNEYYRLLTR